MTKNSKIVLVIAAVLLVIVAVFAYLNKDNLAAKKESQQSGTFFIYAGNKQFTATMDDIAALKPFDIEANYKKNGKAPETKIYQGVSFKALVEKLGIDYSAFKSVSFTAADGYASALTIEEAMNNQSCYIVISMDNVPLGTKENGGSGPYMMILAHDQFSQKWCKFLMEVRFA